MVGSELRRGRLSIIGVIRANSEEARQVGDA